MATIARRGRRWLARVRRGGEKSAKTFPTKAQAQAWASVVESELVRGVYVDRAEAEKITFAELIDRYLVEVTPTKKSAASERSRLLALRRRPIAACKVAAMSGKTLSRYRNERLEEVKPDTVNRELSLIHHIFEIARKEWGIGIPVNPVSLVRRPKNSPGRERRLAQGEENQLLAILAVGDRRPNGTFDTSVRNIWLKPVVQFALETAMRRSEILALQWGDVDLGKRTAKVLDSKNGSSRLVPLSRRAVGILLSLPESKSGKVFDTTADAMKKAFSRAVDRAGITNLRFHDLRHEGTSRLFERGLTIMEVPLLTGHKDLRMLKRYTHMQVAEVVRKLD